MNKLENIIKNNFLDKTLFSKNELKELLNANNLADNDNALRQLIYKLKKSCILQSPKSGMYTTKIKPVYKAREDKFLTKIRRIFTSEFSEINYCIWSSKCLIDFMTHQPFSYFYVFETDKDVLETTFYLFLDNNKNAFLSPDEKVIDNYVFESRKSIVVNKLPVRSPTYQYKNTVYPKLEKILVDIFADKTLFNYYQGSELVNVFSNITERYFINYSALFTYAAVRRKKKEIIEFLKENTNINSLLLK